MPSVFKTFSVVEICKEKQRLNPKKKKQTNFVITTYIHNPQPDTTPENTSGKINELLEDI